MTRDRNAAIRIVDQTLCSMLKAIGATKSLTAASRASLKGLWFQGAREFGLLVAGYCDRFADLLPGLPYHGSDLVKEFDEIAELEAHLQDLEDLTQSTRDTLLGRRSQALYMARGVVKSIEAVLSSPFLDAAVRMKLTGSLKALRKEQDERNKKIGASQVKAWQKRQNRK